MHKLIRFGALLWAFTLMSTLGAAAQESLPDIVVERVWAVACEEAAGNLYVFFAVDHTANEDALVLRGASSPDSDGMTLVEMDGFCPTDEITGVVIPAGERLDLWAAGVALEVQLQDEDIPPALTISLLFDPLGDKTDPVALSSVVVGVPVLEEAPPETLLVVDAGSVWARPTVASRPTDEPNDSATEPMQMGGTSAVYLEIFNPTEDDERLLSVAASTTEVVEIHETALDDNDVMRMRPLTDGLLLPAGERTVLQPGGLHVMLLDPIAMAPGDTILLTLTFEGGATLTLAAPVEDRLDGMMMDMGG